MKKYKIKCIDNKNKQVFEELIEFSISKKYLQKKYESKYRFSYPGSKITIERLIREPGVQVDMLDLIKEMEADNG